MKLVPWVCFVISNCSNQWEVQVTDTKYEERYGKLVRKPELKNIDRETYEFTIAKTFFDAVRSGKIVCTKDTQIRIILKTIDLELGSHKPDIIAKYKSKWSTIDYFDVPKDKFPHGPVLIKELVSQIKSCRHLMQGELNEYDYRVIENADNYNNEYGWGDWSRKHGEL